MRTDEESGTGLLGNAFVGIFFPSAGVSRNSNKLFVPASNTKLYTSWLACEIMSEEGRFSSEYSIADGRLYFRPQGNPLLDELSLAPMIEDCRRKKISEIILETGFVRSAGYPGTWNVEDMTEPWGAPISDVCFHENRVKTRFSEGSVVTGESVPYDPVHRFAFGKRGTERAFIGETIRLPEGYSGTFTYPILDPETFLAGWIAAKIGWKRHRPKWRRGKLKGKSRPVAEVALKDVLCRMNKESSNIIAELLLIHSAFRAGRNPSTKAGAELLAERLSDSGILDASFVDGSGLSRRNLTSPESTVKLLELCRNYRHITESLPVGGKDGTLKNRKLDGRVIAKTGSLWGVQSLSGFAAGEPFSIMVNHFIAERKTDAKVRKWIDETLMSMI